MDMKALENELAQARQARLDALAAMTDVENMILNVQDPEFGRSRLAFFYFGIRRGCRSQRPSKPGLPRAKH